MLLLIVNPFPSGFFCIFLSLVVLQPYESLTELQVVEVPDNEISAEIVNLGQYSVQRRRCVFVNQLKYYLLAKPASEHLPQNATRRLKPDRKLAP